MNVEHHKAQLQTRLKELEDRLHQIEDDLDETPANDFEDRATERENDDVLETLGEAGVKEIRMIRAALDRIDQGTYGHCANCGKDIPEKRLEAVPYAAVCADCASQG